MREKTDYLIIHCSATSPDMDIGAHTIDKWHKRRGWNRIGYHDVIRRDGRAEQGRASNDVGAHAKGYNSISVGICLIGGISKDGRPEDNFTPEQYKTLIRLLRFYRALFPKSVIIGHNQVNKHKACPCFDVQEWLKTAGLH